MHRSEARQVLSLVNLLERRANPDDVSGAEEMAWAGMLDGVTLTDALAAVRHHYATSVYPLKVADVLAHSAAVRAERLAACPPAKVVLPADLDPDDVARYLSWNRAVTTAIAEGTYRPPPPVAAIGAGPVPDVSRVIRTEGAWTARRAAEREARDLAAAEHAEDQRARSLAALAAMPAPDDVQAQP